MRAYLVQHAEAKPKNVDPERGLTDDGECNARAVAAHVGALGLAAAEVWHSGKTRARQTAEILAPAVGARGAVEERGALGPKDDVEPVAADLNARDADVMIVGHLPFMARLAGLLLTGDPARQVVAFRNAGVVCLERDGDAWAVAWVVTPEVARP